MSAAPGEDHAPLPGPEAARRYFRKFAQIIGHLRAVAAQADRRGGGELARLQLDIIEGYLARLTATFAALSIKHLLAGRAGAVPMGFEIDRRDSGFPVFREVMQMATDRAQADRHLASLPARAELKERMLAQILRERVLPRKLQYAMSQRVYYEALAGTPLFYAQNHPELVWLAGKGRERKRWLAHWAVYDSTTSLPAIYLMVVEDSGAAPLAQDQERWPRAQDHLVAQSLNALKLLTIARGFDEDFDDLHPKFLRRIIVGPMYSHAFTEQSGPLRDILAEAAGVEGRDWALSWTTESLVAKAGEMRRTGFFSRVERQVYELSAEDPAAVDAGLTRFDRSIILPVRAYQVMADRDPPGFRGVRKYVVGEDGLLLKGV
jgi:hypothetical protein